MTVIKVCPTCQNEFTCKPSATNKKTYCSKTCMAIGYKTRMLGDKNPNYSNAGQKVCIRCGDTFTSYNKESKYCSNKCYSQSPESIKRLKSFNDNKEKRPPCITCGKKTRRGRKHCPDCIVQYHINAPKPPKVPRVRPPKKIVYSTCKMCGKTFPGKYRSYCDYCWNIFLHMKRNTPRKTDRNQPEIVAGLKQIGCSIIDLSDLGGGVPDLLVSYNNQLYLIEIKNPLAKGKLNKLQRKFFETWNGRKPEVAYSLDDAFRIIGYKP